MTLAQLRAAYGLPAASGAPSATSPIVAVVDAYDDPQAEADLGKYRAQFGLAPCTTPNGCFKKVNLPPTPGQPPAGAGPAGAAATATWDDEITLDLAMASAACPTCRIVLVEAGGQDLDSLASAVNTAATYGPAAIGASWGVPEYGNLSGIDSTAQAAFNHPGVAIAVSAGDAGLGSVQFPASSPYVTSVGGTTLTPDASSPRGYDESVWSQSGNGCSGMYGAPGWQTITNGCAGRAVPDISVLANYSPGIAVYSTADKGWVVMGGTSAGAPFIAGLYAAAGGAPASGAGAIYANASALNVVAGGSGRLLSPNGLTGF
jgi:subtilase family serine protease